MRADGVSDEEIDNLRRLAGDIRAADFSGNEDILRRESQLALSLVEQLELALAKAAREPDAAVRVDTSDAVPESHRELVAEYYRRLGQTGEAEAVEQPQQQ